MRGVVVIELPTTVLLAPPPPPYDPAGARSAFELVTARSGTKALYSPSVAVEGDDDSRDGDGSSLRRIADNMESTAGPVPPLPLLPVDDEPAAAEVVAGDAPALSKGFRGPRLKGLLEYGASAAGGRRMLPAGTPSPTCAPAVDERGQHTHTHTHILIRREAARQHSTRQHGRRAHFTLMQTTLMLSVEASRSASCASCFAISAGLFPSDMACRAKLITCARHHTRTPITGLHMPRQRCHNRRDPPHLLTAHHVKQAVAAQDNELILFPQRRLEDLRSPRPNMHSTREGTHTPPSPPPHPDSHDANREYWHRVTRCAMRTCLWRRGHHGQPFWPRLERDVADGARHC